MRDDFSQCKEEDADGLAPVKDDDAAMREISRIDVTLLDGFDYINSKTSNIKNQAEVRAVPHPATPKKSGGFGQILCSAAIFAAASVVGYLFSWLGFTDTNIVMTYLLAVLAIVWITGSFITGFFASLAATFAFNYFFAAPLYAFSVNDPNYIVTFVTMTCTALATSTLTTHAKRSAQTAREKEAETKAIYNLTNHLTDAGDMRDIAGITACVISECFFCDAACLCFDENGVPEHSFIQHMLGKGPVRRELDDAEALAFRINSLRCGCDCTDEFCDWPIYGRESILGVIRIPKERAETLSEAQTQLLYSMTESAAMAMDRFRSAEQRITLREETAMERYRANLLRSISHDIRTPLSAIIGTSEIMMDMTEQGDARYQLAQGIRKDADWLRSLVENVLSLTRLQDGRLTLKKQPEAVEEVIGEAVSHMAGHAPEHEIEVSVPAELLIVPMDARLIGQVLLNLLDNAVKHAGPLSEISVSVRLDRKTRMAEFAVRDRGRGIRKEDLPHIFETFYTTGARQTHAARGVGLGLAICETIVRAHGGGITARNRTDGEGAEFIFTLPTEEKQPEEDGHER